MDTLYAPGSGYPIGGWTLVLGLFIGAGLLLDAYQFFSANYYSRANWIAWSNSGGTGMQYLYLGQLVIQLNFIAGACAVLFWFLKRRDIFPRMFIWYVAIVLTGRLALVALFYSIPIPAALSRLSGRPALGRRPHQRLRRHLGDLRAAVRSGKKHLPRTFQITSYSFTRYPHIPSA